MKYPANVTLESQHSFAKRLIYVVVALLFAYYAVVTPFAVVGYFRNLLIPSLGIIIGNPIGVIFGVIWIFSKSHSIPKWIVITLMVVAVGLASTAFLWWMQTQTWTLKNVVTGLSAFGGAQIVTPLLTLWWLSRFDRFSRLMFTREN
jgi:hypothetical protein